MELAYRPLQRKLRSLEGHYIGTWLTQEYEPLPRSLANDGVGAFIDWLSFKITVQFLKTDPKARYQGYTFFFKEGFCWTDINSTFLKARLKGKGIFDVVSMSLFSKTLIPDWFYVVVINTSFMSLYVDNFINNTSHFQINDARQVPIVIPSESQLLKAKELFDSAFDIKKRQLRQELLDEVALSSISCIEALVEALVRKIYGI